MSESLPPLYVDLRAWVERARANPEVLVVRQVTEILLTAIGMTPNLRNNMYLKGGALMALAYQSERMTGDVDYTWLEPWDVSLDDTIAVAIDVALGKACIKLGYLDLLCRVQSVQKEPHRNPDKSLSFPALRLTVGYAKRGTAQEKALAEKHSANVVQVDISFNEPIRHGQTLMLAETHLAIHAYSPIEIIAEKLRALLQQTQRKHPRYRRQDIYDIDMLLTHCRFIAAEKMELLQVLQAKAASRDVIATKDSMADPAVKSAAGRQWQTMQAELSEPLPAFEDCYARVQTFYESLPW